MSWLGDAANYAWDDVLDLDSGSLSGVTSAKWGDDSKKYRKGVAETNAAKTANAKANAGEHNGWYFDAGRGLWVNQNTGNVQKLGPNQKGSFAPDAGVTPESIGGSNVANPSGNGLASQVNRISSMPGAADINYHVSNDPTKAPKLVQDPVTGLWFNPATGQAFADQGGTQEIHDPGIKQQIAFNFAQSLGSAAKAQHRGEQFDQAFGAQMSLADLLNDTIKNVNAPSVAAEQESQALQANQATALSQAAGASGGNAFLARRNAADNVAGLNAADAQTGALRRAQEVADAQKNLGSVLTSAASGAIGQGNIDSSAALQRAQLAQTGSVDLMQDETQRRGQDKGAAAAAAANNTAQRGQNIGIAKDVAVGLGSGLGAANSAGWFSDDAAYGTPGGATSTTNGIDPSTGGVPLDHGDTYGPPSPYSNEVAPQTFDDRGVVPSDKRLKNSITPEGGGAEDQFLGALQGKSFKYNDDDEEDPERHGVLTDDLKRSQIGSSLVRKSPSGFEGFDVGQGLGAALSALGYLHSRLTKLEGGDRG